MDLGAFLGGISTVDLLIFLYLMAFFVLGFAQGTIRRLIGIASILFSFLFAANIAEPLGEYLGQQLDAVLQGIQRDDRVRDRVPGLGDRVRARRAGPVQDPAALPEGALRATS